ncbi:MULTISPECIES: nucleotidyltransferase domain-containing protein [Persephonella]|uniref:DNA polymerase, beta domain protein region n=1 Tax=Persephonella marina (strain DSM 14350 / EX-H1) TaxID=123214 RepID=C0QSU7_PERMH|nr:MULTISPECIES: nucleotidyltransferase domain-containing protein [Persephonella]ACO04909.1 DNA polymerase, beta domain protein region [Persephonella marina EX-H1]
MENKITKVRLTEEEIKAIKETAQDIFGKKTEVYLFGSRTDIDKKGGDIDLYIIPEKRDNLFDRKLKFLVKLKSRIGEQKIDVIIAGSCDKDIEKVARETGVLL